MQTFNIAEAVEKLNTMDISEVKYLAYVHSEALQLGADLFENDRSLVVDKVINETLKRLNLPNDTYANLAKTTNLNNKIEVNRLLLISTVAFDYMCELLEQEPDVTCTKEEIEQQIIGSAIAIIMVRDIENGIYPSN